jgi:Fe-S cluster biogenesis protein NfuA
MADLKSRVAEKIAEMQPFLEKSGGHLELVDIEDGVARVRLSLTRPGPSRLVVSLQMKSGIERALRNDIPELRGVEAINLPPYSELGWDQPAFVPVDLPIVAPPSKTDATAPAPAAAPREERPAPA